MDQLIQCPVCTLYLHNGMSLESHLDTHPKDQVIKALCCLTSKGSGFGSRTSTPANSERSYRSRSRTPADDRWNGSQRSSEPDRYWRRPPSRTPKSTSITSLSRNETPEIRDSINFDTNSVPSGQHSLSYGLKSDKMQQFQSSQLSDFEQPFTVFQEPQEDREIKYSRSAEYTAMDNVNNVLTYNIPPIAAGLRFPPQNNLVSAGHKKAQDFVKILPKPNNILLKTNVGGIQYITSGVKPMHVMVPTTPTFVQKNIQNNMLISGNISNSSAHIDAKVVAPQLSGAQFNNMSTGAFTPSLSTVVTQNSQIIYREMVHNIDGKPFISSMPTMITTGPDAVTNVAQSSSMYQNLMVLDQFGSCMYTPPQQFVPKSCTTTVYTDTDTLIPNSQLCKNNLNDPKTLIIEVGPIIAPESVSSTSTSTSVVPSSGVSVKSDVTDTSDTINKLEYMSEASSSSKGLKILSNIKVEVPVQHNKNMVNTLMDLTESNDPDFMDSTEPSRSPEKILPDLDDDNHNISECIPPSNSSSISSVPRTFTNVKSANNVSPYKELCNKVIDSEFSDSCPIPDLICNEKPSISPCSELSENGDNSTDRISISPKPQRPVETPHNKEINVKKTTLPVKSNKNNSARLNNIFVKKTKKILQIKNAKTLGSIVKKNEPEPMPSTSTSKSPENFIMMHDRNGQMETTTLLTVSVEEIKENDETDDFNTDIGTPMQMEPGQRNSLNDSNDMKIVEIQVKEEVNTSNEGAFSNDTPAVKTKDNLRPIHVIPYSNMSAGDFDDESNHRELLDLEAASKGKQFVSMMNENYFGENLYPDYFTTDRDAFGNEREITQKDGMYNIWGEPSQKENEFVLPNFIQDTYKITDSTGIDYSAFSGREVQGDKEGDGCEKDSKADVLSESRSGGDTPLNICADERMPARGELSGQESNGDMESAWSGIYTEVTASEPYDLIARESWVSDGSEVDLAEKMETLDDDVTLKKVRGGSGAAAGGPGGAASRVSYSRLLTARTIKRERSAARNRAACNLITVDSKASITTTILQSYDMEDSKPKIEGLIKQETKRRRKDFVCSTCKVDQLTDAAFHAHLKIHPLECMTCGKCFYRRANLALHIKTHLGIKNYKCDVCEKRFITRQKLTEHHNIHTGRSPIKCTHCDETFKRYSNMLQHRDRHHLSKRVRAREVSCECGLVFASRARLRWHRETHAARPHACALCSDKFVHAASLTRHLRRTHRQPDPHLDVPCPVCKQLYIRTNLRAHMQTHTGKRPFPCVICNKSFTTKWNLKLHRWTHMNRSAKPFKCHLCKGAFIRQSEYVSHMNAHKSVRPYTCNYCGCKFIRKYNCQRHVREHETAKKFVCKVQECGKSFHRSYYLSEHMKVHSGVRPFACNICGKTSSNKSNHNKHIKIHHAREPVATEA
ncbi:uncharacterized protein LOC101744027 [Bombyx mori]|uniref:C2H2-type domain-containing protein n=1 Tax=Bombyx mori TaxID=7091 RepID=A0A8R2QSH0_BOMMO|nr:uncharacterized protein LOC101744027 [Bombyx mori]